MAITTLNEPQVVTPALNPEVYIVSSTIAASANQFRFICDVRNNNNVVVTRLKADRDINMAPLVPSGCGYFDVSQIVRTLIVPVKQSINLAGFRNTLSPNTTSSSYSVVLGEQYIDNATNPPTIITTGMVTGSTRYAVFGQLSQMEYTDFSMWLNRFPANGGVSTSNFPLCTWLTKNVYSDTYDYLSMGQDPSGGNAIVSARVTYYNQFNVQQRQFNVLAGAATHGASVKTFGSGAINIKSLTSAQCSDGATNGGGSTFFPDYEGGNYTIEFGVDTSFTTPVRYVIRSCTPYKKIGVWFLNKYGVFESFYFAYKNRQSINVGRNTYLRNVRKTRTANVITAQTNVFEETSTTIYSGNQKTLWNLNSAILTEKEYTWLQEMIDSSMCYLDLSQIYPTLSLTSSQVDCVIQTTDYNLVTRANDRQKVLNIQVQEGFVNNIL